MHSSNTQKLVTLSGECFDATFELEQTTLPNRDGTLHKFRVNDLIKGRGERLVSLFFANFDRLSIPQFEQRLEIIRLNTIRRAFDSDIVNFDSACDSHTYQEIPLSPSDFTSHSPLSDPEIRQYLMHKVYWLSYKYGNNFPVQLIDDLDLDYLGVGLHDMQRGVWYLREEGFIDRFQTMHGAASLKLVKAYEASHSTVLPSETVFPADTQYEAFKKINALLQSATSEIFITDNYLDGSVLDRLEAVSSKPSIRLLTEKMAPDFKVALQRFRRQYPHQIEVRQQNKQIHDRAIIIDKKDVYTCGASIKDAGDKLFVLTKLEDVSAITKLQAALERIWQSAVVVP